MHDRKGVLHQEIAGDSRGAAVRALGEKAPRVGRFGRRREHGAAYCSSGPMESAFCGALEACSTREQQR